MFLLKLLTSSGLSGSDISDSGLSNSSSSKLVYNNPSFFDKYGMPILLGALFVLIILWMFWSSRKRKKQQEETMEKLNSLQPGTKIETIGGVFGTIVEMNKDDGTFVLETGSEKLGKTYIRFDRNAIARIEPSAAPVQQETPAEPAVDEAPEFEPVKENAEEVAEEKTETETEEKKD